VSRVLRQCGDHVFPRCGRDFLSEMHCAPSSQRHCSHVAYGLQIGTSVDEYVYFTIPTNFKEGHWVQAVALQPGNRRVVHHAHVSVIEPDRSKKASAAPKSGRSFSDYLVRTSDGLRHLSPDAPVVDDACGNGCEEPEGLQPHTSRTLKNSVETSKRCAGTGRKGGLAALYFCSSTLRGAQAQFSLV
jgi:hypothetical protein